MNSSILTIKTMPEFFKLYINIYRQLIYTDLSILWVFYRPETPDYALMLFDKVLIESISERGNRVNPFDTFEPHIITAELKGKKKRLKKRENKIELSQTTKTKIEGEKKLQIDIGLIFFSSQFFCSIRFVLEQSIKYYMLEKRLIISSNYIKLFNCSIVRKKQIIGIFQF
ncbi:hypothetical protein BpHYR1_023770 [Brachionus plicatilis]|uniref:Uncharacterized protein n=1 Tax=Brachionus plicatilis TaxID=10195 RepID=A0A3M7SNE2_BRAPC|nr:hypothetical protein BpHYR1_023770 [Brachionus plicatilis]